MEVCIDGNYSNTWQDQGWILPHSFRSQFHVQCPINYVQGWIRRLFFFLILFYHFLYGIVFKWCRDGDWTVKGLISLYLSDRERVRALQFPKYTVRGRAYAWVNRPGLVSFPQQYMGQSLSWEKTGSWSCVERQSVCTVRRLAISASG